MEAPATIEEAKEAWSDFIAEAEKKKKRGVKKGSKKRARGVSRAIESESGEVLYPCSACNKNRPGEAFHKDKAGLDGIRYVCIACRSEQRKCERETPRGIIGTLCGNAISNSKARAKQEGKEKMREQCEIPGTIEEQISWIKNKAGESPRPRCRSPRSDHALRDTRVAVFYFRTLPSSPRHLYRASGRVHRLQGRQHAPDNSRLPVWNDTRSGRRRRRAGDRNSSPVDTTKVRPRPRDPPVQRSPHPSCRPVGESFEAEGA